MYLVKRKALLNKMINIYDKPLTILCAPNGYGKTQILKDFVRNNRYQHIWISMNEHKLSEQFFDRLLQEFKEYINPKKLEQFTGKSILKNSAKFFDAIDSYLNNPIILVIDDYSFIKNSVDAILNDTCRVQSKHLHIVVSSRYLDKRALVEIAKIKYCDIVTAKTLQFSPKDILLLSEKEEIGLTSEEADELYKYTHGWNEAVVLCLESYQQYHSFYNANGCNRLIEKTFSLKQPIEIKTGMMNLSILGCFTLEQAQFITQSERAVCEIILLENTSTLVIRQNQQEYQFIPLIKDYLKQQLLLSDKEMYKLYARCAEWFVTQKDVLKAIAMFLEIGNFEQIIRLMQRYDLETMDRQPELILEVFNRMPEELCFQNPYIYLTHICDNMTNIDTYHGMKLLEKFKQDLDDGKYIGEYEALLGEYYFIRAFSKYNDLELMMEDFHLAYDCFNGGKSRFAYPSMIATFGSYHMLYLYHHTAGKLQHVVKRANEEVKYFVHIAHGVNAGAAYQVSGELAFETGQYKDVAVHAEMAYNEAMGYRQYSIAIASLTLRARFALLQKDKNQYIHYLTAIKNFSYQRDNPIISGEIDCAIAYVSILNNEEETIADWLKRTDVEDEKLLHEASMVANMIRSMYHMKKGNYQEALMFCNILKNAYKEKMHIFGYIYALIFTAIIKERTQQHQEALIEFSEALDIAEQDQLVTVFIEFSEDISLLLGEVSHPFAEKIKMLIKEFVEDGKKRIDVKELLTKKETEIAILLMQNYTAKAIAAERIISLNTVQTHMKSIYKKLGINSKFELIERLRGKI